MKRNWINRCQAATLYHRWQTVLTGLCVVAFCVQVAQVSRKYFDYLTDTDMRIENEKYLKPPGLSICFRYIDMIEPSSLRTVVNDSEYEAFSKMKKGSTEYADFIDERLTLKQFFDMSPDLDVISCRYRIPGQFVVHSYFTAEECNVFFVRKTLLSEFICYQANLNFSGNYHFSTSMKTLRFSGLLIQPYFNHSLIFKAPYSIPVVHDSNANGEISRLYASASHIHTNDNNFCRISYMRVVTQRLPPPYETRCHFTNNSATFRERCHKKCMIEKISKLYGRFPFSEVYTMEDSMASYSNLTVFDNKLHNKETVAKLNQIGIDCAAGCPQPCLGEVFITKVQYSAYYSALKGMAYRLDVPCWPLIYVEYKPKQLFHEYLIFVMSCLGTWLGLDAINLNPFCRPFNKRPPMRPRAEAAKKNALLTKVRHLPPLYSTWNYGSYQY